MSNWKLGPNKFWQNSMPRLEPGEVPFGSLDEKGDLIIQPAGPMVSIVEGNFDKIWRDFVLELIARTPSDGYTTQVVLTHKGGPPGVPRQQYLTLILGVFTGLAIETWPKRGMLYSVGCTHEAKEQNSYHDTSRGNHHFRCEKCGFEYYCDSGD